LRHEREGEVRSSCADEVGIRWKDIREKQEGNPASTKGGLREAERKREPARYVPIPGTSVRGAKGEKGILYDIKADEPSGKNPIRSASDREHLGGGNSSL